MPEGDVVARVARRLFEALGGQVLAHTELRWPTLAGRDLTGRTITEIGTYGKHMLTRLDDGMTLRTHLRMEGHWRIEAAAGWLGPSDGVGNRSDGVGNTSQRRTGGRYRGRMREQTMASGPENIRVVLVATQWAALGYHLGMVDLLETRDEPRLLAHLGPDVLAASFDPDAAGRRLCAQGARGVGEALLDQGVVAGLGTIYMAESLWHRGIYPLTACDQVAEPAEIYRVARRLMLRSVAASEPTATGLTGRANHSAVHGRLRGPCPRCGTPVEVIQVGTAPYQRPAFYCPTCQPASQPAS